MAARELLKGPKQNQLYFIGNFGFVVKGIDGDKVGFLGSKQYFEKGKENG